MRRVGLAQAHLQPCTKPCTRLVLYVNVKTSQLCGNSFSTQESTKDDGCLQLTITVFVATNDYFVDNFNVCTGKTRSNISILFSKENCF